MARPLHLTLLLSLLPITVLAQTSRDTLVTLGNLSPREFQSAYFAVSAAESLTISAVGGEPKGRTALRRFLDNGVFQSKENKLWDSSAWPGNAWILDARTRDVVWELKTAHTLTDKDGLRIFNGAIALPAGTYQVGYATLFPVSREWSDANDWRAPVGDGGDDQKKLHGPYIDEGTYHRFGITIRGAGRKLSGDSAEPALVKLRGAKPSARERIGFELDRAMPVEIYLVGEHDDDWKDYGLIMNAANHSIVWTSKEGASEYAGGSRKNRKMRQTVNLSAGKYVAAFFTDGSHQISAWTEAPPYDAPSWGLTVRVVNETDRKATRTFEYNPVPPDAFVSMIRLDDDELRWQRFTLTRAVPLQVLAIGEGSGRRLQDYAWIVDSAGRVAWRMRFPDTQPAGGSEKNRVFAGTVDLAAGSYVAYVTTDGSHSYRGGWNADQPMDGEYWGLTIGPALPKRDASAVKRVDDAYPSNPSVLARLTRVRGDREEEARFTLPTRSAIRIYAVGEGRDEMSDYATIADHNQREVWRMGYAQTEAAGGASKNRRTDRIVTLDSGTYTVRFKTDGSHGWDDWTSPPPDDPLAWGVTIFRAQPPKP